MRLPLPAGALPPHPRLLRVPLEHLKEGALTGETTGRSAAGGAATDCRAVWSRQALDVRYIRMYITWRREFFG